MSIFPLMRYIIPRFLGNSIGFFSRTGGICTVYIAYVTVHHADCIFARRMRCSITRRRIMSMTAPTMMPPFSPTQ